MIMIDSEHRLLTVLLLERITESFDFFVTVWLPRINDVKHFRVFIVENARFCPVLSTPTSDC